MTQVFGILTDPSGRPMQRQTVRITRLPVGNPFDTAHGAVIQVGAYDTDTDGRWDANLIPSSSYEDTGQYYQADCRDGLRIADAVFTFQVPATGGPYNIRDLLVTVPPVGTPIPPVAAHHLGDHIDVDTTGVLDGQVLEFVLVDGKWEPRTVSGGGGGGVNSVTAANGTIVIAGSSTNPTVAVGTGIPQSAITTLVADLAAKYVKPGPGIPAADMAAAVQTALTSAGTAVQPGSLAAVAFSGAYSALIGAPTLATVATTGAYADLTGKPTIPSTPGDIGAQPADGDLTAIAAIAPANDDVIQRKAGAWINRTPAQLKADLALAKSDVGLANVDNTSDANKPVSTATAASIATKQPLATDLTAIAGLTPANDDLLQRKAGAWTNRTPAQVKTDLALTKADVGLGNVDNTSDVNKPVSIAQAAADALAVAKSTATTKGDLLAASGAGTLVRVGVGSDGQWLVADSTQTAGVKWTDGVTALTDAATIATDASTGEVFTVTLGGNRTLGNPTNSRDGMHRTWRFRQDGTGTRTITLGSNFSLGSNVANTTLNGTAGKVGYLTAFYDATNTKWHVVAFEPGA